MEDKEPHMQDTPLVFKLPLGLHDSTLPDLKWLGEEIEKANSELAEQFADYQLYLGQLNLPTDLLRAKFEVLRANAEYHLALLDQQRRRHGFIQTESDAQEMVSQLEHLMKNSRDNIS